MTASAQQPAPKARRAGPPHLDNVQPSRRPMPPSTKATQHNAHSTKLQSFKVPSAAVPKNTPYFMAVPDMVTRTRSALLWDCTIRRLNGPGKAVEVAVVELEVGVQVFHTHPGPMYPSDGEVSGMQPCTSLHNHSLFAPSDAATAHCHIGSSSMRTQVDALYAVSKSRLARLVHLTAQAECTARRRRC